MLDNRAYLVLIVEEHGEVVGYLASSTSEAGALWVILYRDDPAGWDLWHANRANWIERETMDAEAIRHFYGYHITENRALWERYVTRLTAEQFTQPLAYAHGSVRDQLLHLMDVDDVWFSELQGVEPLEPAPPAQGDDRQPLRARWDTIEQRMRAYLAALQNEALHTQPIQEPEEDRPLRVWQVLLHVVNHGTDHRAQLLRSLHDLGLETRSQDYIFYVYDHP